MTSAEQQRRMERWGHGELVDLRPTPGERVDASGGIDWVPDRSVAASQLMTVLTTPVDADEGTHRPLRLAGARITGRLDLEAATLTRPLHLEDCFFEQQITLNDADAITIRLTGCHLPGLDGHALRTRGDLRLNHRFTATGEVNLVGASIRGNFECDGASFTNQGGIAFNADRLEVEGNVFWRAGFAANGEVRLPGAHVGGNFECDGASFTDSGGRWALNADGMEVDGNLFCRGGFAAYGEVRLLGAHVGGNFECDGATFTNQG